MSDSQEPDSISSWNVQVVTVDLDDDSVKQPAGSTGVNEPFPTSGKQALLEWNPHLIYVDGGNTFWLHHCMEKEGYQDILKSTLGGAPTCCYCGSSAGAILVGASMQTACWKGWDNPQIVPGMESYDDWQSVEGLDMAMGRSFFPHMVEEQWRELVNEKKTSLPCSGDKLVCLNDEEILCYGRHMADEHLVLSNAKAGSTEPSMSAV
mmetsp:Transcript_304/g.757  ORF Transcript_304/g.757 Transcript_304/m.757 type:complete len:207 (-) Transcript_304:3355-3975(-)